MYMCEVKMGEVYEGCGEVTLDAKLEARAVYS